MQCLRARQFVSLPLPSTPFDIKCSSCWSGLSKSSNSTSTKGEDHFTQDTLSTARRNHILASIHLDRYHNGYNDAENEQFRNAEQEVDLDKAEKYDQSAFKTRDAIIDALPDSASQLQQHREYMQLFVEGFELGNNPTRAEVYRGLLRSKFDQNLLSRNRRFSDSSLQEEEYLPVETKTDIVLEV